MHLSCKRVPYHVLTRRGSAAESSTRFASDISDTTSTNVSTCVSMERNERKSDKGHAIDAQSGRYNMTDGTMGERCQEEGTLRIPHPHPSKWLGVVYFQTKGLVLFDGESDIHSRGKVANQRAGHSGNGNHDYLRSFWKAIYSRVRID
jgi:hypothetical protein